MPVAFQASISGRIAEFKGGARLHFGNQQIANLDVKRNGDTASLTATVSAAGWPLLADIAERTGDAVKLEGGVNLADMKRVPIQLTLTAPAGRVNFSTVGNFETIEFSAPARLSTEGLDLAFVAAPLTGKVDADGEIRLSGLTDFVWKGEATAGSLTFPSGSAAQVTTPLTLIKDGVTFRWEAPAAVIEGVSITSLKSGVPARYTAAMRGEVNIRTHLLEITQAQIRGEAGDVSARGTYDIGSQALKFAGAASFTRLADVAPLTGSARGQWTVARISENAPFRITADAAGRAVGSRIAALAQLTGPEPRLKMTAVAQNGRFIVESGAFDGAGITANLTGRITDSGAIIGRASGALCRPPSPGAATMKTLAFTADVSGKTAAPSLDITLANGAVLVAGLDLTGIGGDIDATFGTTITGGLRLAGNADGQPLSVTSRMTGGKDEWRLTNLNAHLGGLTLTAPQLAYADSGFRAAFGASGSLVGLADITRGTLSAHGQIASNETGLDLDIAGQINDVRRGAIRLQLATFEAEAQDDKATLSGRLRGTLGTAVDLAFSAKADRIGDLWSGGASLTGKVGELPVATSNPLAWTYDKQVWTLAGDVTAFGGRISTDVASGPETVRTSLELADIDLRILSRLARFNPVAGRLSGRSSFSNTNGVTFADMSFTVADANPVGVTTDPLTLKLDGELRNSALTLIASGSGQGFDLDATALLPFETGEGFKLAPAQTRPIQGRITVTGRAEQLWALFGPEGQSLRGKLDADVRIAGTMNSPTLDGGFAVAEGAYEHGETGLRLRDITARGEFNQHSATITDLSANDGASGRITGEGDIQWNGSVTGGVRFIATNLRALGREDRTAIVSGNGAVTLDAEAMHVTGDLTVSQARISIEQPASASIPTLPGLRRINFPNQDDADANNQSAFRRPIELNLKVNAPRRIVVFGRGLDTEWSTDVLVTGQIANPSVEGTARLVRGTLDLAGRRFAFDTGEINLDGPIRNARINILAARDADDIDAIVRVTGTPGEPRFTLESLPSLPQDEILSRVLFGRSASELSALEAAQLAASLAQLAGGQAGFDPAGLIRQATGLDRVAIGASKAGATVSAGKYIADDVYLQVGAGGEGGVGAEVEWEPRDDVSIISSAQGNGDTRIAVRWKKDY
jgi:translocation and assembly module TamB